VHGDDFIVVAREAGLAYIEKVLREHDELKVKEIGPRGGDAKELQVLGRVIRYTQEGITCEADPALVEQLLINLKLTEAKGVVTPWARPAQPDAQNRQELLRRRLMPQKDLGELEERFCAQGRPVELLEGPDLHRYQSAAALMNYIGLDRPEILYEVKELMMGNE
jgi:hypothetical protein